MADVESRPKIESHIKLLVNRAMLTGRCSEKNNASPQGRVLPSSTVRQDQKTNIRQV